jgi:NodT family efflux transporter outer membrane factor (OMF) lipoprotein
MEHPVRRLKRTGTVVVIAALLLVNGCMVGPDYVEPTVSVNAEWLEDEGARARTDPEPVEWWKSFNDPVLDALVEEAWRQNLSLRAAAVRVIQAMAQRGITVGELFPQSQTVGGGYARNKLSENPPRGTRYQSNWDLGFDASWELDVWGRYRRSIESADAALDASLASYDDVMVTLVSEVAATYVQIRTIQVRILIAEDNIRLQTESLRLANSRFTNGKTSQLDVYEATASLESTRATLPSLRSDLRQTIYRLNLLLGTPPKNLMDRLGKTKKIPVASTEVAMGIPADLLRRRPDIRLAERQAAAQSAAIGIATADLYPAFRLSGSLGWSADDSSDLLDHESWTGSFAPGFSWAVLNYGRIRNNVRVQDALFQEAVINYRNAVLNAAGEVESGLVAFLGTREQVVHLEKSTAAAKRQYELSMIQYKEGASSFTRVLDAQSQLRASQQSLALTQGQVATNLIATYKALGGGWQVRKGMDILPEETRAEMEKRTNWGDMLDPDYVSGRDLLLIPRHDPSKLPEKEAGAERKEVTPW